jgi:DNA-binding IclR family transcriptional regulator
MQPIVRALTMLRVLAAADHGLTLQELSERAGTPLTSTHRIVAVLADQLFLTRSPTNRRYYLGPAVHQLSEHAPARGPLGRNRVLEEAARESGETVFVTELIDGRAVCVALVEAARPLRLFVRIGQELPLVEAASARVLLSELPDGDVRRLTARGADELLERLELVRSRGYDCSDNELDAGVWAISVPVRNSSGGVRAGLTIAAPGARAGDAAERRRLLGIASHAAAAMSADLGFQRGDVLSSGAGSSR